MEAVMILRGNEPTWSEAKRQLGKPTPMGAHSHRCTFDTHGCDDHFARLSHYHLRFRSTLLPFNTHEVSTVTFCCPGG